MILISLTSASSFEEMLNLEITSLLQPKLLSLKVHKDEINSHKDLLKFIHSVLNGFNHCQLKMVMF